MARSLFDSWHAAEFSGADWPAEQVLQDADVAPECFPQLHVTQAFASELAACLPPAQALHVERPVASE